MAHLQNEKDERMKAYDEARAAEKIECESTGSVPCYIVINRMPTDEQVRQIKKNVSHLRVNNYEFQSTLGTIHKLRQPIFVLLWTPHTYLITNLLAFLHSIQLEFDIRFF